ncbi:MAG TPA: hypothetical protein VK174_00495, partial [Chitinophagales bacterium]|nr:hypothetical protein [Chitinophagales bacterium]
GVNAALVTNGVAGTLTVSTPSSPTVEILYNNCKPCINSEITVTKASGTWALPTGLNWVNDQTATTQSFNTSSASVKMYSTSVSTSYNLASPLAFDGFITTTADNRTAPTLSAISNVCVGTAALINCTPTNWTGGSPIQHEWNVFTTDANSPVLSSTAASLVNFNASSLAAGTYNLRYRVKDQCCGWSVPAYTTFTITPCDNTWIGVNSNWADPDNWSLGIVPSACDPSKAVVVNAGASPVVSANADAGTIEVANSTQITIDNGVSLSVCGDWIGAGSTASVVNGGGTLILTGGTNQILSGKTNFQTLHVDKGTAGVTMQAGSVIDIYKALELKSGNFNSGSGTLTLKSSSAAHAIFNDFGVPYGSYTGTFTGTIREERYYEAPSANSYNQHYMGSPVSNADLAQFGAGGSSGAVTPTANCDETQLSQYSVYGSVFSYNQANGSTCALAGWYVEAAGNTAQAGKGYSVAKTGAGTLTLTGTPNTGGSYTQTGLINSGWSNTSLQNHTYVAGWQLVSNPYNATLDLTGLAAQPGFDAQIKVWVTHGPGAGSYQDATVIAPFQAFFIKKNGNPGSTYTIDGAKRVVTPQTFQLQNNDEQLTITATNNNTTLTDVTTVAFNSDATTQFDVDYDANKLSG